MYKTVYPGQQICFDEGRLACKVVAVYEHRVTVECLNDYIMTSSIKMMIPKGKMDDQLIQEKEMAILRDLIVINPEIEFISLPNVRDGVDIIDIKRRLNSVDKEEKIKYLSKI